MVKEYNKHADTEEYWNMHKRCYEVEINGKEYVAQDVGGGVKGNHIDIYFNTHGETREHGVRNAEVFIIQS